MSDFNRDKKIIKSLHITKKGFTLIEILTVIILLGIISIIGIVAISNHVEETRKSSFVETAKLYARSAMELKGKDELLYEPSSVEAVVVPVELLEIEEDGYITPYGEVIKEKSYVLVVNAGGEYKYYVTVLDGSNHGVVFINANEMASKDVTTEEDLEKIKTIKEIENGAEIEIDGYSYKLSERDQGMSMILLGRNLLDEHSIKIEEGWSNSPKKVEIVLEGETEGHKYYVSKSSLKPISSDSLWQESNEFMLDEGIYYGYVIDENGEISDGKRFEVDKIDKTSPSVSVVARRYIDASRVPITVKITIEETESGLSSTNTYEYCVLERNKNVSECTWASYTNGMQFTLSGDPTLTYDLWIYPLTDNVGNTSDDKHTPYAIWGLVFDGIPPTIEIEKNYTSGTSADIKITAEDKEQGLSSYNKYEYCLSTSNTSAAGCTWTPYTNGTQFTVTGSTGDNYLWIYPLVDKAGNIADGNKFTLPENIGNYFLLSYPVVGNFVNGDIGYMNLAPYIAETLTF